MGRPKGRAAPPAVGTASCASRGRAAAVRRCLWATDWGGATGAADDCKARRRPAQPCPAPPSPARVTAGGFPAGAPEGGQRGCARGAARARGGGGGLAPLRERNGTARARVAFRMFDAGTHAR
uniref:Uncharacterized protein n=1 Tax=Prasinoderma coloniale TaxID=156133 RepID=A0A7R9TN45_9VIRI|mmetsp:Transcript_3604/g.14608  ORF Transcript_3604/g.14608 Transcript_3604/m.14608 type:complete len:123 (+) Transcript_3604:521-889(+)